MSIEKVRMVYQDPDYDINKPIKYAAIGFLISLKFKITLDYDNNNDYGFIEFYMDTPSNKSFLILGGMYDPTTGYVYASLNKNRKSVIAYDAVEVFNYFNHGDIDLNTLTDLFIQYKLSGDLNILDKTLTAKNKKSVIYRHLNKITENEVEPFDAYIEILSCMSSLVYHLNYCNNSFNFNSGNFEAISWSLYDYPKITMSDINDYKDISIAKSCSRIFMKNNDLVNRSYYNDLINKSIYLDGEDAVINAVVKENLEELYDTKETLVYSKDTVSTLRRNGFTKYVTKKSIPLLKKCDNVNLEYHHVENDRLYNKYNDYSFSYTLSFLEDSMKDLIYIYK